eukprot:CAMPEP_0174728072 /NCGR_PEP_ID=MMETSP1094-20130205/51041_1 /TAXON_ID=156173 /ORGANISM="Chrysochromulina brevifilum, Strain UTEX LB 985" /LENGTH=65 /DNA_ID=CAMNT_0015929925 /DNA_START=353 /DNA_END=546 /DNA_ORIENTATION=-
MSCALQRLEECCNAVEEGHKATNVPDEHRIVFEGHFAILRPDFHHLRSVRQGGRGLTRHSGLTLT